MTELLTAAQMRAIEAAAIASGEVTGLELMERAGRGVVEAIFEEWPELRATSHRAVVLCGPGGNGGDGFVVARLLKEWGWKVEVFLYGDPEKMPPDARVNYERWVGMGEVRGFDAKSDPDWARGALREAVDPDTNPPEVIVDAVFGTGLKRPLPPDVSRAFEGVTKSVFANTTKVVAVDVPSGLCSDSGRWLGETYGDLWGVIAMTVTFHRAKTGHFVGFGPFSCRRVVVKPIGIGSDWRGTKSLKWREVVHLNAVQANPDVFQLGKRRFPVEAYKYSHGHALILAGHLGRGGAARLAARGALRIGAGVVTVGCPHEALPENAARLDAIMLRAVHDRRELARVLEDRRINALCLGPGMGTGKREAGLVAVALQSRAEPRPAPDVGRGSPRLVLDADALTILSHHPDLFAALHEACVLTPHAGEFARLFPDIAEKLAAPATKGPAYSKVDATREAAARAGCVVLYKGPDTVIADPSGRAAINSAHYDRAAPWLATAGSGDVLAGFITGLLARGFSPFDAACTGAWLHVECARSFGPGLIAEDLPEELPKVFRALGL
jgi:ADP-dependent NAD(P)H-hydrate dehydratase / NAD(P)H-hydrate epimerase